MGRDPILTEPCVALDGTEITLGALGGKVLLIVNTASECGFTKQYAGLEMLWRRFGTSGLVVAGFPCNQFGKQEPGDAQAIALFCDRRFNVTFPMFSKVDVIGRDTHPVFRMLKQRAPGLLGQRINWNFTKFLVDTQDGTVQRFAPMVRPERLAERLERMLNTAL